ncbi:unnamed protein product, partial [Closterium sp. NIES-53]
MATSSTWRVVISLPKAFPRTITHKSCCLREQWQLLLSQRTAIANSVQFPAARSQCHAQRSEIQARAALCPASSSSPYDPSQQQQQPFQPRGIAWGTSVARLTDHVSQCLVSCNASPSSEYSTSSGSDSEDDASRGGKARLPARMAVKAEFLQAREAEAAVEDDGPIPRITEDKVTLSFARSGGPGGQNVNKLNTKVDMRFNVLDADWLPERIRWKILEQEKNRVNSDGEIVVSSTRTRTQKGNIEDALAKLQ